MEFPILAVLQRNGPKSLTRWGWRFVFEALLLQDAKDPGALLKAAKKFATFKAQTKARMRKGAKLLRTELEKDPRRADWLEKLKKFRDKVGF